MATPSFGGTNGVPALDIGQVGSTRRGAGTHRATVKVHVDEVETVESETTLVQENYNFVDRLGISGRPIAWECVLRASSEANFNTVLGELEAYTSGKNFVTGTTDPTMQHRTQMVAHGRTYEGTVMQGYRPRGGRFTLAGGWVLQRMDLVFREIGDVQA